MRVLKLMKLMKLKGKGRGVRNVSLKLGDPTVYTIDYHYIIGIRGLSFKKLLPPLYLY